MSLTQQKKKPQINLKDKPDQIAKQINTSGMSRHQLLEMFRRDTPGPAQYLPQDQKKHSINISLKGRYDQKVEVSPGPGQYNVDESYNASMVTKSKVSIRPKSQSMLEYLQKQLPTVGPADYKVNNSCLSKKGVLGFGGRYDQKTPKGNEYYNIDSAYQNWRQKPPQVSMTFSNRMAMPRPQDHPGFAYANQASTCVDKPISFTRQKREMHVRNDNPGPGAYTPCTDFKEQKQPQISVSGRWEVGNNF